MESQAAAVNETLGINWLIHTGIRPLPLCLSTVSAQSLVKGGGSCFRKLLTCGEIPSASA